MKNLIGGIEFPKEITARSCARYRILGKNGEWEEIAGWEFMSPTLGEATLIIPLLSIEEAAKKAFDWFDERGHL